MRHGPGDRVGSGDTMVSELRTWKRCGCVAVTCRKQGWSPFWEAVESGEQYLLSYILPSITIQYHPCIKTSSELRHFFMTDFSYTATFMAFFFGWGVFVFFVLFLFPLLLLPFGLYWLFGFCWLLASVGFWLLVVGC